MAKYFEDKGNGVFAFYDDQLQPVPISANEISDERFAQVMTNRPTNKTLSVDADGLPIAIDTLPRPYVEIATAYLTGVRGIRERILNRLAGIALFTADPDLKTACASARQALLDITSDPGVLAATDAESLNDATVAAYHAIVDAAPLDLKYAFNDVDL